MCHVSCVTCHLSTVTCHMSPVTCHFFIFYLIFYKKNLKKIVDKYIQYVEENTYTKHTSVWFKLISRTFGFLNSWNITYYNFSGKTWHLLIVFMSFWTANTRSGPVFSLVYIVLLHLHDLTNIFLLLRIATHVDNNILLEPWRWCSSTEEELL